MADLDTTPMDAHELRPCRCCGKGVMHDGSPVFYEMAIRSCVVDMKNVRRMHGLEMMLDGAVGIARALSPSNTVAQRVGQPARHLICMSCATSQIIPLTLLEDDYG